MLHVSVVWTINKHTIQDCTTQVIRRLDILKYSSFTFVFKNSFIFAWWGPTELQHVGYSDVVVDGNLFILVTQLGSRLDRPNNVLPLRSVLYPSFPFVNCTLLTSSAILSIRLTWVRPTFLVPSGFVNVSFLQGQISSFLKSCPSHLALLAVILKWLRAPYTTATIRDLSKFANFHLHCLGHIYSSERYFQMC